jgi:SAM-dependent methyltransferase
MHNPIGYLHFAGLIHKEGAACLDVGTREGRYARELVHMGYKVHAIDIKPLPTAIPEITFEQVSIESFTAQRKYNLIFARNVLPYTADPLLQTRKLIELLAGDGVLFVTFFGHDEPWANSGKITPVSYQDALNSLDGLEMFHWGSYHERGPSLSDGKEKLWHIHSFVGQLSQ